MGFLTDKCVEIRNWLAIGEDVYPNTVVTSWIRMAEEYLSTALRVKHMIQIDTQDIYIDRVNLPLDWQEIRMARLMPGGSMLRYQTPDAFFNPEYSEDPAPPFDTRYKRYCIMGNYLIVHGSSVETPNSVELTYYQNIPRLTEATDNWVNSYHPMLYTLKILHIASLYAIEDARSPVWDQEVVRMVNGMNAQHKVDMASGSVLMPVRRKTFG
jgi:hypothetical protein